MGCITIDFDRLGNTPTPTLERVGATPTAEVEYLGGVPIASLIGLSDVPTAVLEHLGGMTVSGSLLCYVGNDTLTISEASLSFTNEDVGTTKSIAVFATADWSAELNDPNGLFEINHASGVGGKVGRVDITLIASNPNIYNYSASVVFKSRGLRQTLTLVAEASEATYTRLTYIEADGQQYINTGYVVQEDDVIEMDYISTSQAAEDKFLFSAHDDVGLWCSLYSNAAYVRFGYTSPSSIANATSKYSLTMKKGNATAETTSVSLNYSAMPDANLILFAAKNLSGGIYGHGYARATKFRITDGSGNVVMDLRPYKRESDGAIGMLDMVSGNFFASESGVPFIAGSEVRISEGYEVLDSVAFNGDKIFDACVIDDTQKIDVQFKRSDTSAAHYLYGVLTSPHTASVTAYLSRGGNWRFGDKYKALSAYTLVTRRAQVSNGTYILDVTTSTGTESDAFTTPDKLIIGGYRDVDGIVYPSYIGDIKYFRVYNADGTLALDWYPCKRISDNVEGFWDCVTQTFIAPRE